MFDDTNEIVEQEVQNEQPEEVVEQVEEQKPAKPTPSESFKQLREQREKAERERDEALRLLQQYQQPKQVEQQPEDDDLNIGESDLAEGRHITKVGRKIKKLEDQVKRYQEEASLSALQLRIQSQFPDFESVVNNETVNALKEQHPEVALAIQSTPDMYNKAASAYKLIKKLGIVQDESFNQEKQIIRQNAAKPRPAASLNTQHGNSPLSQANAFANGLTDDLKAKLHKEMIDAMKGV
jgi:hypothetical protein